MRTRFKVHRHKTNKPHFDLRIIQEEALRSWSLLKPPPAKKGERRLAIERERRPPAEIDSRRFYEQAFGEGGTYTWDEGEVDLSIPESNLLVLEFRGRKLNGRYELKRTAWYPGNRWLLLRT